MPSSLIRKTDAFFVQICPPSRFLVRREGEEWEVVCCSLEAALIFAVTLLSGAQGEMTLSDERGVPFLNLLVQRNMGAYPTAARACFPKFDEAGMIVPPRPAAFLPN